MRHVAVTIFALVGLYLQTGTASAQDFPSKPLRIVTNAPGGDSDFAARLIVPGISALLGQPVIVENTGGAIPSMVVMAKAAPDGYTMLFSGTGLWTLSLLQPTSFDMERDMAPLVQTAKDTYVLVVHPSLPVKSVKELIALAKSKPGELNYSTSAAVSQIATELFNSMAGTKIVRISYKGTPAAARGVASGEVQVAMLSPAVVNAFIKAGRLRALAVTSAGPSPVAPGLPPVSASLPGYELTAASGMWVPAKTPEAIINRLNREIVRVLNTPEVKEKFVGMGLEVVTGPPEQFAAVIRASIVTTTKVIKEAGIKME